MQDEIDLDGFSEEQLIALNRRVVARLKALYAVRTQMAMLAFGPGERVCFDRNDGSGVVYGRVLRTNKKTVSVIADGDSQGQWNVAPGFLRKVKPGEGPVEKVPDPVTPAPVVRDAAQGAKQLAAAWDAFGDGAEDEVPQAPSAPSPSGSGGGRKRPPKKRKQKRR